MSEYEYEFDPTGQNPDNLISGEQHVISPPDFFDYYYIVPKKAPFFSDGLTVTHYPSGNVLIEGVDYTLSYQFLTASFNTARPIYGAISINDQSLSGTLEIDYQTLGGKWALDDASLAELLLETSYNPRTTSWEQVVALPETFPPIEHDHDIQDMVGASHLNDTLKQIRDALGYDPDSTDGYDLSALQVVHQGGMLEHESWQKIGIAEYDTDNPDYDAIRTQFIISGASAYDSGYIPLSYFYIVRDTSLIDNWSIYQHTLSEKSSAHLALRDNDTDGHIELWMKIPANVGRYTLTSLFRSSPFQFHSFTGEQLDTEPTGLIYSTKRGFDELDDLVNASGTMFENSAGSVFDAADFTSNKTDLIELFIDKFYHLMNAIKTYVDTRKAPDSDKLDGKTYTEAKDDILTTSGTLFASTEQLGYLSNKLGMEVEDRMYERYGVRPYRPTLESSGAIFESTESILTISGNGTDTWLLLGSNGKLAKANADFSTYTGINTGITDDIVSSAYHNLIFMVGTSVGEVYQSTDDGDTFTLVDLDGISLAGEAIVAIDVFSDGNWAVFTATRAIKSSDTGWVEETLPAIGDLYSVAIQGTRLYIAGANGMFSSDDQMATWSFIDTGLTEAINYVGASETSTLAVANDGSLTHREEAMGYWIDSSVTINFREFIIGRDQIWVGLDDAGSIWRSIDDGRGWRDVSWVYDSFPAGTSLGYSDNGFVVGAVAGNLMHSN